MVCHRMAVNTSWIIPDCGYFPKDCTDLFGALSLHIPLRTRPRHYDFWSWPELRLYFCGGRKPLLLGEGLRGPLRQDGDSSSPSPWTSWLVRERKHSVTRTYDQLSPHLLPALSPSPTLPQAAGPSDLPILFLFFYPILWSFMLFR